MVYPHVDQAADLIGPRRTVTVQRRQPMIGIHTKFGFLSFHFPERAGDSLSLDNDGMLLLGFFSQTAPHPPNLGRPFFFSVPCIGLTFGTWDKLDAWCFLLYAKR